MNLLANATCGFDQSRAESQVVSRVYALGRKPDGPIREKIARICSTMRRSFGSIVIPLVLSIGSLGNAEDFSPYFAQLRSPFMEILQQPIASKDEGFVAKIRAKFNLFERLRWDPNGGEVLGATECDLSEKKFGQGAKALFDIQAYLRKCEAKLEQEGGDPLRNGWTTVSMRLHPESHPYARHVIFHLPQGQNVKGLVALKPDGVKRPLILLRLGIFSSTTDFYPERYLFLQLFEQSPFNVILLESTSGSEYLQHNDSYSIGGFYEGIQNFAIARQLQNSKEPISKIIDSVHMVGVSLGGNGTLYSGLLNDLNPIAYQKPPADHVFASFLGLCPLVHFAETFDYHKNQEWSLTLMNIWANLRMGIFREKYPGIRRTEFVDDVIKTASEQKNYFNSRTWDIKLPVSGYQSGFYEKLNFMKDWKSFAVPFWILSTVEDPVVPYELNSERLFALKTNPDFSRLAVTALKLGQHCSLPANYNWSAMTTLFQKYFISQAYTWAPQSEHLLTEDNFYREGGHWVVNEDSIYFEAKRASRSFRVKFPVEKIPYYKLQYPLSDDSRSLVLRWLNQNVRFQSKVVDGRKLTDLVWEY